MAALTLLFRKYTIINVDALNVATARSRTTLHKKQSKIVKMELQPIGISTAPP